MIQSQNLLLIVASLTVTFEGELVCEYDEDWGSAWLDEIVQELWVCEGDLKWNALAGNGIWDEDRENKINIVTITPSVNAIDVTFPTEETIDQFFVASQQILVQRYLVKELILN